ncbi:hypothetical protein V6N12_038692 [Hibiscus sabdariffa]|uniref:RNase H type-1 domain-containing protein n=1 Tax=Hibiscus sabdariffa TaxID=183260 RepID=A0ABR2CAK8_9ROSI
MHENVCIKPHVPCIEAFTRSSGLIATIACMQNVRVVRQISPSQSLTQITQHMFIAMSLHFSASLFGTYLGLVVSSNLTVPLLAVSLERTQGLRIFIWGEHDSGTYFLRSTYTYNPPLLFVLAYLQRLGISSSRLAGYSLEALKPLESPVVVASSSNIPQRTCILVSTAPSWQPAPMGYVKVNVDGVFELMHGIVAVGVIAHNNRRTVLGMLAQHSPGWIEVGMAKIYAIIVGLQLACTCGWESVLMETDLAVLVNKLGRPLMAISRF